MSAKKALLNKTKIEFYNEIKKFQATLKPTKELEGYASGSIVGEKNYPNLKVHSISNNAKSNSYFNTSQIVKKDYTEIFKLKAKNILGSTQNIYAKSVDDKIKKELEDIYKSKKPIEFNSTFEKELKFDKIIVNKVSGIAGSKNSIKNINATQNTSTSKQIEKYASEDIKSQKAVIDLYERGINEHQIINLLSFGTFGMQLNKKLVPTRWSISAYDSIIEKHLFKKIINYKIQNYYEIFHKKDKGNSFVIITFPDNYSAEIIETWDNIVESDYANYQNKLDKKEPSTAGGYYATKLPIFEYLNSKKKQAGFISIRIIEDYDIPLGVVFVRETVRDALKNKLFKCTTKEELIEYLIKNFSKHFKYYLNSKYLKEKRKQKRLNEFL